MNNKHLTFEERFAFTSGSDRYIIEAKIEKSYFAAKKYASILIICSNTEYDFDKIH